MKKKLSLLIVLSLILSLVPAGALMAEENGDSGYDNGYDYYNDENGENGYDDDEDNGEDADDADDADGAAEDATDLDYEFIEFMVAELVLAYAFGEITWEELLAYIYVLVEGELSEDEIEEILLEALAGLPDYEDVAVDPVTDTIVPIDDVVTSADPVTLRFVIGSTTFTRDGVSLTLEYAPFLANARTMVPFRALGEALGAEVDFNDDTQYVYFSLDGTELSFSIDAPLPGDMGSPILRGGRTFVPLRFVSEQLGFEIDWDEDAQAAYVIG